MERKRKILLIDDDASLLRTVSDFLRFEGYEIVTAESGEKGLDVLEITEPDLIILDMSMPGMGGVGFLKSILGPDGKPTYPVLVLTARANMAEFFANIDVDGFIAKPCDPQDLLMEVGRIIFLRSGDEFESSSKSQKSRKLLVGESDSKIGRRLVDWFAARGFVAELVDKGPDVLERAIVTHPDCVVMNAILAGMNGRAVADLLGTMPGTKGVPVVLYDESGIKLPETSVNVFGGGVAAVLASSEPSVLQDAVSKVLG